MHFRSCLLLFVLLIFSTHAFANLPYFPISFPRDEAAHFENVPYQFDKMMEWWYYNGTLTTKSGKKLGYYMSFNYVYNPAKKMMIPFIGIQVTDIDRQKVYGNKIYLLDKNSYSLSTSSLDVNACNSFSLRKNNETYLLEGHIPTQQGINLDFSLQLTPKPGSDVLLIGGKGLADMWDDTNSYYYSYTKLITNGFFKVGNEVYDLDPQQSLSWMDHQWGDFIVIPMKNQWLWTSIQLQNGMDINLGAILDSKTKKVVSGTASIVMPDNSRKFILDINKYIYTHDPVKPGDKHPLVYHLSIPEMDLQLNLEALVPGQDLNGIWEGVSKVEGMYKGEPISGQAYTENSAFYNKFLS